MGQEVNVLSPDGNEYVSTAEMRGGESIMESDPLAIAGFYEVAFADAPLTVAANIDQTESDVKVMEPEEIESAIWNLPVRLIDGDRSITGMVTQARTGRELWLWLLGAAAVLMVIEAIFSRWSTKHGSSSL